MGSRESGNVELLTLALSFPCNRKRYEGVRNQVKKLTNKPTMRWIFQMFQAVHLVTVNGDKQVSNLTQDRQDVLKHLGQYCSRYYLMFAGG